MIANKVVMYSYIYIKFFFIATIINYALIFTIQKILMRFISRVLVLHFY